jgi:hydroxymethylpyrimidine pyrophosphatase-like HAD family hydrolase
VIGERGCSRSERSVPVGGVAVTGTLIVADVDGTLVTNAGVPYPGVDRLLAMAARPGCGMALSSARPPWSLRRMAREMGPAVIGLSAFQGAMVQVRVGGPDRWHEVLAVPIDREVMGDLNDALDPTLARWWYTAESWTVSREDAAARAEARIVRGPWAAVDARPPIQPVLKLLAVGEPERVATAAPALQGVRSAVSKPEYLEIVSSDVDPDKGIGAIRAIHPDAERLVALGDAANDIGMLRAADLAFTFADGAPEVIAAATVVLPADRATAYRELVRFVDATT